MDAVLKDLRYALALLGRNKTFTAVALLTLALCIGANTAIFSVINAVLLRPLPYPQSDRLVILHNQYPNIGSGSATGYCCNAVPDYFDRRDETSIFDDVTLFDFQSYNVGIDGSPQLITGLQATPDFFDVFRVAPAVGRPFLGSEADAGAAKVAILSAGLRQELFPGDPSPLGRTIRLSGEPYEIVGVMPHGFDVLSRGPRVLVPMTFTPEQREARHSNSDYMVARLAAGVGVPLAQERIDALNVRVTEQFPDLKPLLENAGFRTEVADLREAIVRGIRPTLRLLQVGVAFVLLIGTVNIATLLLIHSNGRSREFAVRAAMGASRTRIVAQVLTECVGLAGLGAGFGLVLAMGALGAFRTFGVDQLPRGATVAVDGTVVAFVIAIALIVSVAFGILPALQLAGGNIEQALRAGGRSGTPSRAVAWTRQTLVVAQVALAFVLLIGAALMTTSLRRVVAVDPGFVPDQVWTGRVNLPASRYSDDAAVQGFARRALDAMRSVPSVTAAGLTSMLPFGGDDNNSVITIERHVLAPGENPPGPHFNRVAGDYFETMGIPLVAGRSFDDRDSAEAPPVVIIDQELADRYWPDRSPVGDRLRRGIDIDALPGASGQPWATIVGVVGRVTVLDLARTDRSGTLYFPMSQDSDRELNLAVQTDGPVDALQAPIRAALLELDPELPLFDVSPMTIRITESLMTRRIPMTLLLICAAIALFLSAIGVYGVLAHSVSQRTKELGIRMALGASASLLLRQILWQGTRLVLAGLVVGLAGALGLGRLVTSLLYGVAPTDPAVFGIVIFLLVAVSLVACLIPSRRATQVDPVTALRDE